MAGQTKAHVVFYGFGAENDVLATDSVADWPHGTRFRVKIGNTSYEALMPVHGEHMVYAALAALAAAWACGLDVLQTIERLKTVRPAPSRMELITLPNGARILDDSGKGSLESYRAAIEALRKIPAKRRIAILGNVHELPNPQRPVYRELGWELGQCTDRIVFVGSDNYKTLFVGAKRAGMRKEDLFYAGSDVRSAAEILRNGTTSGDVILIKGDSTQQLRRIALSLLGNDVRCHVRYCAAKVEVCDECPFLGQDPALSTNRYVRRLIRV
jgi:UDP-N-acetylmuramoyl-tripeptide--D-alanyl-D-alanine ligase